MFRFRITTGALLALIVVVGGGVWAAENLKSGPQVGSSVPGPFHPLHITGENAGQKVCLYCKNGANPVAMIFAREVSPTLTTLIKKIDAATAEHQGAHLGSFVVFLKYQEAMARQLKQLADKEGIQHTVLSLDAPAGPQGYRVSKNADVTVVLYTKRTVKANYAFRKGELTEKDVTQIVADLSKILPN
jgi:hypothetical protein